MSSKWKFMVYGFGFMVYGLWFYWLCMYVCGMVYGFWFCGSFKLQPFQRGHKYSIKRRDATAFMRPLEGPWLLPLDAYSPVELGESWREKEGATRRNLKGKSAGDRIGVWLGTSGIGLRGKRLWKKDDGMPVW